MTILDASALLELILNTPAGQAAAARIADPAVALHVPHLADVEVAQALRRYVRSGELAAAAAQQALADLRARDVRRHAHEPLLERIWALRGHLSADDAAYVALAEALDAPLLSCDAGLAHAPGMARRVELVNPIRA